MTARFWAVLGGIFAVSLSVLFVGSQVARDRGQSVDWYTGFGQWLGALASFMAAGVALWIAGSDRRRSDNMRVEEHAQQEADLARQAGLVQVNVEMFGVRQAAGANLPAAGIGIRNRRADRVFDIDVVKLIHQGTEVPFDLKTDIEFINGWATSPVREMYEKRFPQSGELIGIAVDTDELLIIYQPQHLPNTAADYAAIAYTDPSGRRWQVDTKGVVTRL